MKRISNKSIVILFLSFLVLSCSIRKSSIDDPMYNCRLWIAMRCLIKKNADKPQQNIDKKWCEQVFTDRSNFSVIDKKGYVYETYCRKYEPKDQSVLIDN